MQSKPVQSNAKNKGAPTGTFTGTSTGTFIRTFKGTSIGLPTEPPIAFLAQVFSLLLFAFHLKAMKAMQAMKAMKAMTAKKAMKEIKGCVTHAHTPIVMSAICGGKLHGGCNEAARMLQGGPQEPKSAST